MSLNNSYFKTDSKGGSVPQGVKSSTPSDE